MKFNSYNVALEGYILGMYFDMSTHTMSFVYAYTPLDDVSMAGINSQYMCL